MLCCSSILRLFLEVDCGRVGVVNEDGDEYGDEVSGDIVDEFEGVG